MIQPLLNAIIAGIENRFPESFKDTHRLLASAFHPQFKLYWFKWLLEIGIPVTDELKESVRFIMISLVDSQFEQWGYESGSPLECDNDLPWPITRLHFLSHFVKAM